VGGGASGQLSWENRRMGGPERGGTKGGLVMEKREFDIDTLYEDLAGRFRALGQLFDQFGSRDGAHKLVDSLISEDGAAFNRLIEPVDIPSIPQLGICAWVREIIDRVVVTPTRVEVCVLREDLTPEERALYLSIAMRHGAVIPLTEAQEAIMTLGQGPEIPPGPFLEELKANGLVHCDDKDKHDVSTVVVLGKPERVCV
jgi:hypothetical protein